MIDYIEYEFVETFINKNKKDRLIYELRNLKKRRDAVMRFCHNEKSIINENKIVKINEGGIDFSDFINFFASEKKCYYLSLNYLDGIYLNIDEAYKLLLEEYLSVIIYINGKAIIKNETEGSCVNYYFLKK